MFILNTHPIGGQHILCLLLPVLGMHFKGVSILDVLLEERQQVWGWAVGGRPYAGLSAG